MSDSSLPSPERPRLRWLWFYVPPVRFRTAILRGSRKLADRLGPLPVWILLGAVIGILPLGFDFLTQWCTHWLLTPLLALPFLSAAVVRDSTLKGMSFLAAMLVAHCAISILFAAHYPERWADVFPAGAAYWDKSYHWIATGQSKEYDLGWWVPAHVQLAVGMIVLTYLSMGLIPLWQGLHEVGLMNFYVGRLLAHSDNSLLALSVGWHPWSVCRGVGYLFLTFEIVSLSFAHFTGTPLSTIRRRKIRWMIGLSFLLLDGILKFFFLENVRRLLASNLL